VRRFLLLGMAILLGIGLILVSSCGDDDETTGPQQKQTGDPNDPMFLIVDDFAGEAGTILNMQLLAISFGLIDEYIDTSGAAGKLAGFTSPAYEEIIVVNYDTSDYWHIFECSAQVYDDGDYYYYGGIDSLRFGSDTGYMYIPDTATVNSLNIRAHFNIDLETYGFTADLSNHAGLDLTGEFEGDFTANGYSTDSMNMYFTVVDTADDTIDCEFAMTFNQELTNILIDEVVMADEGCPLTGRLDLGFTIDLACEGTTVLDTLNFGGAWVASFVFNNGVVTATYENATTRWTYTEECRDGVAVKQGWARTLKRLVE
jgi:hypothetical protein